MASIGAVSCDLLSGEPPALKQRSEIWNVPGIDGYGVQVLGTGDAPFALRAVYFGTIAAVSAWAVALQALQGTVATVVNDAGVIYTRCFLASVGPLRRSAARRPGTAVASRGEIEIEGVRV